MQKITETNYRVPSKVKKGIDKEILFSSDTVPSEAHSKLMTHSRIIYLFFTQKEKKRKFVESLFCRKFTYQNQIMLRIRLTQNEFLCVVLMYYSNFLF